MRILVLSAHTTEIDDYAQISIRNKREYCEKHGYDFINKTDGFDLTKHPSWSKVLFIKQHLPDYDYVFWMDSDTLIMRFDIKLEKFIENNEQYDLIFTAEEWWNGSEVIYSNEPWWNSDAVRFNLGIFFTKNSQFSFDFLNEVYGLYNPDFIFWEQTAMWKTYSENKYSQIKILPSKGAFNSPYTDWKLNKFAYRPGDFICHFSGIDDRYAQMCEFERHVIKTDDRYS